MLADYHVHTEFSFDSNFDMEEVVKQAISMKLDEICFTDHVDYGVCFDHDEKINDTSVRRNVDYPNYFKKIAYLQDKYNKQISIKKGLEFGVQTHTLNEYESLYNKYPMDFIILSNHQMNDIETCDPLFFKDKPQIESTRLYYQGILDVMKVYKHYSVLGHLDYIVRYDPSGTCEFKYYEDLVKDILTLAIKENKGIEINMSYFRNKLNDTTPNKDILKMYHDLGGRIITIGTDSHKKEHLGKYLDIGKQVLKDLGYKEFATFDKMKPIFHEL